MGCNAAEQLLLQTSGSPLCLARVSHTSLGAVPLHLRKSLLKPPSQPTPKSAHGKWDHSHFLCHRVIGSGPHKPDNFPKCSLQKENREENSNTRVKFKISFINILCYKNIFGKITLIASFFVFYYTLKELFMTIRGEGVKEEVIKNTTNMVRAEASLVQ